MGSDTCAISQHRSMSWGLPDQPCNFGFVVAKRDNASGSGPLLAEQSAGAASHSTGNWRQSSVEHSTANKHAGTAATAMSQRVGPYEAAGAGAARQFKKALLGSSRASQSPVHTGPSAAHQAPEPDYGDYADHSSEYGMHASCLGNGSYSRRTSCSSYNQARPAAATSKQPANGQQQLQTSGPSVAVSRSIPTGPPAVAPRQQSGSGAGTSSNTSAGGQQQLQQCGLRTTHKELLTPDYGVYGDSDDYGADLKSSRRSRLQAPHSRPRHARKPPERRQRAAVGTSSAEQLAIEAELAALRAALEEAEARQVEAQLAVITLETDNTTLQAQLQGMRQQKQQLEMMLLFGGNDTLENEEYSSDGSTSSLNKESPVAE